MNFGRGLFRFWLVVSILWGIAVCFWAYLSFQAVVGVARQFGITGADWLVLFIALAAPIVIAFVFCLIAGWVLRGFRA